MPGTQARTDDGSAGVPTETPRSVREVILDLSRTEDALREWRTRTGRREVPVLDVHALLTRQRQLVAELRLLSGTIDLTPFDDSLGDRALDGPPGPAPQVAS